MVLKIINPAGQVVRVVADHYQVRLVALETNHPAMVMLVVLVQ